MTDEQKMKTKEQTMEDREEAGTGTTLEKRELARQQMKRGTDKNERKAVSLLEECAATGDADAMLMLAKCCALGRGTERDTERAETLLSESANKGNEEAQSLIEFLADRKEQQTDLDSLLRSSLNTVTRHHFSMIIRRV